MNASLTLNSRLLAIIGRRNPAIYDAVIPRFYASLAPFLEPSPSPWFSRLSAVALNPQPLPPGVLGAGLAGEFIHAIWLADRVGNDAKRIFADLDDWCPTKPKRLKLPPWWPPIPDPDPGPDWFVDLHLGFAARLAAVSVKDAKLGEATERAIERSLAAIESVVAAKK